MIDRIQLPIAVVLALGNLWLLSIGIFFFAILGLPGSAPAWGAPPNSPVDQESTTILIRRAAHAADEAWEEFHRAAIGGTLASPVLQSQIERQLHEIRSLLMDARKAERDNQPDLVKALTQEIFEITDIIIQSSRERKS